MCENPSGENDKSGKGITMYRIVKKRVLNPTVTMMEIEAPAVARKAEPGQFIILRVDENGERIPLTIAAYDRERGTVSIIFQVVGATTEKLNHKEEAPGQGHGDRGPQAGGCGRRRRGYRHRLPRGQETPR